MKNVGEDDTEEYEFETADFCVVCRSSLKPVLSDFQYKENKHNSLRYASLPL